MLKIDSNVSHAMIKMQTRAENIQKLDGFFRKRLQGYYRHAYGIVLRMVYIEPGLPKVYVRTKDTLNSVSTELIKEKDARGMKIFLDSNKVSSGLRAERPKAHRLYPAYVMRGIWLWNVAGALARPRPFLSRWYIEIGKLFEKEFKKEFSNAVRVK